MSYRENDHEYESHEIDDDHSEYDDLNEWEDSLLEYSSIDAYDDRDDFIAGGFEEAQEHLGSVAHESADLIEAIEHADSHLENEIDELHTDDVELADTDGDGLLERISETWTPANATVAQTLRYVSTDGDDSITGGTGVDTITQAGAGNDTMNLGAGDNVVTDAGSGNDTITATTGNDTVTDAGAGNDTLTLGNGTNTASGNSGDDVITGGTGADTFTGGADKDTLNGDAGADKLYGDNAGTKEVATLTIGGTPANTNTVAVTLFGTVLTVTLDTTTGATVASAAAAVKAAIDSTFGDFVTTGTITTGAFTITSKLDGNVTDYSVSAGGGGATASFGSKTDGGVSSGGVDTINAGAGADFVFGGEGKDTIDLGAADGDADSLVYVFNATAGGDNVSNFEAGTGNDVIKFAKDLFSNGTLTATLKSVTSTGTIADNDTFVEVTTAAAAGGVDTAAEVATFLANLGTSNVGNGEKVLLALQDGVDMYLWAFTNDATAAIASSEVALVAKLVGVTDIADGDLAYFA